MITKEDISNFFDNEMIGRFINFKNNDKNIELKIINETMLEFFNNLKNNKNPYLIEQIELKKELALTLFEIYSSNPIYQKKLTKVRFIVSDVFQYLFDPNDLELTGDELLKFLSVMVKHNALNYKVGDNLGNILQSADLYKSKYGYHMLLKSYDKELLGIMEQKYLEVETDSYKIGNFKYLANKMIGEYIQRISLNQINQSILTLMIRKGACLSLRDKPFDERIALLINDIDKPLGITSNVPKLEEFKEMFQEINDFFVKKGDVRNIFFTLEAKYSIPDFLSANVRKEERALVETLINQDNKNIKLIEQSVNKFMVCNNNDILQDLAKFKFKVQQNEIIDKIINEENPPILEEKDISNIKIFTINTFKIMDLLREHPNASVNTTITDYGTNEFAIMFEKSLGNKLTIIVEDENVNLLNIRDVEKILIKLVINLKNSEFRNIERNSPKFLKQELRSTILLKQMQNTRSMEENTMNKKYKI